MKQFEDQASKEKVMKQFPIIDDLEPWQSTEEEKFEN